MADLSQTASSVLPGANADIRHGTAGEAITAGMPIYQDTAGALWQADANDTEAKAAVVGIAISSAEAAGQKVSYVIEDDDLTIGATVAAGDALVLSATKGGIAPEADLATDDYVTFLGIGKSATKIAFKPIVTGAQHA